MPVRPFLLEGDPVKLSLLIPTLNRIGVVYNVLRHLEHQTRKPDEIVIVDQTDRRDPLLEEYAAAHPEVNYIRIKRKGLPNARNVAIRNATGDILLFVDDDIVPDDDLVRIHFENYADPSVAGVGGLVRGGYDRPDPRAPVGTFVPSSGMVVRNFGVGERRDVDHLPGGHMSFRREVFEKVGGFDPTYGGASIGEETDFCLRAVHAGFRLVYDSRAALDHLRLPMGGCRAPTFEEWLFWHAHNGILFVLRHAWKKALPGFVLRRVARFTLFAFEKGSLALPGIGLIGLLRGVSTHLSTRG